MLEDWFQKSAARATVKQLRTLLPAFEAAKKNLPFSPLALNNISRWIATKTPFAANWLNKAMSHLGHSDAKRYAEFKRRVKQIQDAENYTRMNQAPGVLVTKRDPVTHLPTEYKTYGDENGVTLVLNPRTGEVLYLRSDTVERLPSDMATRHAALAGGRLLNRDTVGLSRNLGRTPRTAKLMLLRGRDALDEAAIKTPEARSGSWDDEMLRDILTGKIQGFLGSSKWNANNVPVQTPPPGYKLDEVIEYGGALIPVFQRVGKAGLFTHDDSHFRSTPKLGDYDMSVRLGLRGLPERLLFSGTKGNPTKPHEVGHAIQYVADLADRNIMARRLMLDMDKAIRKGFSVGNLYKAEASIPESLTGNQRNSAISLNRFANNPQAMREAGATNAGLRWFQKNRGLNVRPNNRGYINLLDSYRSATPIGKATQEQLFYNYRHMPKYAPTALNALIFGKKLAKPTGIGGAAATTGYLADLALQNWLPYNRYINWWTGQNDEQPLK